MFVGPLAGGFVTVAASRRLVERPDGLGMTVAWVALMVAVSAAGALVVQRMTLHLAPLSTLFRLTLVFPDEAPSRFSVALRNGSARGLAKRVVETGSAQASAEHLLGLVAELGRHDRMTRGHSERVRAYSVMLGEEIGLSQPDLDRLNWAALIHDVGKLHVPAMILAKPGRPTEREWQVLRTHPAAAAQHVEALRPWLGSWVDAATQHHERYDGGGYPKGLRGDEISLAGRLVSIADAFDVMTAPRSYKAGMPPEQARAELLRNAGTQFDPGLVRSFLRVSLGRIRWVAGPLGWLSHFPEMVRTPIVAAASSGQAVVVAAAVTVAGSTGLVAISEEVHAQVAAERVVEESGWAVRTPPPRETSTPHTSEDGSAGPAGPTTSTAMDVADGDATGEPRPGEPTATTAPTSGLPMVDPSSPTTSSPGSSPTTSSPGSSPTTSAPSATIADDDYFTVERGSSWLLTVHTNDAFGPSGPAPATMAIVAAPSVGTAMIQGLNIRYTAPSGVGTLTTSLVYEICNYDAECDTATVTITVDVP